MSNENDTVNVLARRIENLPKWAQDHIKSLEREVERAHQEAKEARLETEDPSNIMFLKATYSRAPIALPTKARIIFKTPTGEIRVRYDHLRRAVSLMAEDDEGGEMIVRPEVSNVVVVGLARNLP